VLSLQVVSPVDSDMSLHEESSDAENRPPVMKVKVKGKVNKGKAVAAVGAEVDEDSSEAESIPPVKTKVIMVERKGKGVAAIVVAEGDEDVTDDSDEDVAGKVAKLGKLAKLLKVKGEKAVIEKKPRKERDIAVTSIPQIRENMDQLVQWIQGYELLYNLGHKDHKDTTKKMTLLNEKAKAMVETMPELGEVTGKYHDCVDFSETCQ